MKQILFYLTIPILLFVIPVTNAYGQANEDPTLRDHVFLVVFEPGPEWIEGKPVGEQNLREHGQYIMKLYEEGKILQAGPFTNDTGGAVIYRVENIDEVEILVANDPAILAEKFNATIHPWRWVEWDYHLGRR
jgi:uncharacterized protein YciI